MCYRPCADIDGYGYLLIPRGIAGSPSPGVSRPGPAPPLPVPLSSGLRGSPGLSASAVRHGRRRAQTNRPGRRQRRGDAVPVGRRLHAPVPQPQLQPAVLGPRRLRGPEREEEHLQRLQVSGRRPSGLRDGGRRPADTQCCSWNKLMAVRWKQKMGVRGQPTGGGLRYLTALLTLFVLAPV